MAQKENKLVLYKDEEGRVSVNVRFADEDVWLTRVYLAQFYATTPQNISLHIGNIYHDKELDDEATRKKFFLVRQEGKRLVQRNIAPQGHQAHSSGHRPGYEWQRFIRPGRAKASVDDMLLPLWGVVGVRNYTQGAALGYEVIGLSGRNK